ncbi:MAG TPA: C-terminal binding protein [Chloroflexota bacterium]|nr:C-terminal binding protein [Chloroflexota bacterium]
MTELIAILDCNFPSTATEEEIASAAGQRLIKGKCKTEDDVIAFAGDASAIIVQYAPVTARVIGQLRRCRVITRYGIGVDNVDVEAATRAGIWVTNVPGFCAAELAEHTMAMLLSLTRRFPRLDKSVRAGGWETIGVMRPTRRLTALTLGLIGFGRVGREVARLAQAFGMAVLATAPRTTHEEMARHEVTGVGLEELLVRSDVVSLHLPLTVASRHLIDTKRLRLMKPTGILINTSRGPIVDESALIDALQAGRLAGAGLDVLETEPPRPDNPLLAMDNVILTPHAAYYSDDSLAYLQSSVAEEVVRVLRGERPRSPVNPETTPRVV